MATKSYEDTLDWLLTGYTAGQFSYIRTVIPVIAHIYERNSNLVLADIKKVIRRQEIEKQKKEAPDTIGIFRL